MAITAQDVATRVGFILNDEGAVRWTTAELLLWVSDGQREAQILNPTLYTKTIVRTLAAGTAQSLADLTDYILLLSVTRNIAANGVTPGKAVVKIDSDLMDAIDPDWHTAAPETSVAHWMFNPVRRYEFRVQPPVVAGVKVELTYGAAPPTVTSMNQTLVMPDHVLGALADYVCYRAISKDTEAADELARAQLHYKQFAEAVTKM